MIKFPKQSCCWYPHKIGGDFPTPSCWKSNLHCSLLQAHTLQFNWKWLTMGRNELLFWNVLHLQVFEMCTVTQTSPISPKWHTPCFIFIGSTANLTHFKCIFYDQYRPGTINWLRVCSVTLRSEPALLHRIFVQKVAFDEWSESPLTILKSYRDWNKVYQAQCLGLWTKSCLLVVCTCWTRLALVRPAASLYSATPLKHHATGGSGVPTQTIILTPNLPVVSNSFMLSAKQSSTTSNFNVFCLSRPGIEPPTSRTTGERSTTTLPGRGHDKWNQGLYITDTGITCTKYQLETVRIWITPETAVCLHCVPVYAFSSAWLRQESYHHARVRCRPVNSGFSETAAWIQLKSKTHWFHMNYSYTPGSKLLDFIYYRLIILSPGNKAAFR